MTNPLNPLASVLLGVSCILLVLFTVLWKAAPRPMLAFLDWLSSSNVSLTSMVGFFIGLGLLTFSHPLEHVITSTLAWVLIFGYFAPLLMRISARLFGGVESLAAQYPPRHSEKLEE